MRAASLPPRRLTVALQTFGRARRWREALKLLFAADNALIRESRNTVDTTEPIVSGVTSSPRVIHHNAAMAACLEDAVWEQAVAIFARMQSRICVDVISCNIMMRALSCGHHWQAAFAVLGMMPSRRWEPSLVSYNTAIAACEKRGQWNAARSILLYLLKVGSVVPDVLSFNSAISAAAKGAAADQALQLMSEMRSHYIQPTVVSYCASINACERVGAWEVAFELVATAWAEQVEPDLVAYNGLISACGRGWRWELALAVLGELRRVRHQPDVVSWGATVASCAGARHWEAALHCLKVAHHSKGKPNVVAYSAAISACEKGRQWERAIELLANMRGHDIATGVVSLNTAIRAIGKGYQWERALCVPLDIVFARVFADVISFNATISACEKGQQWEAALWILFHGMHQYSVQPNVVSFNATISACEKRKQWRQALELVEVMASWSIQPDIITFNASVSACELAQEWQRAFKLLVDAQIYRLKPDLYSFNSFMSTCEKASQWELGLYALFHHLPSKSVEADLISFNVAICNCEQGSQWQAALTLLSTMGLRRLQLDANGCIAVARACERALFRDGVGLALHESAHLSMYWAFSPRSRRGSVEAAENVTIHGREPHMLVALLSLLQAQGILSGSNASKLAERAFMRRLHRPVCCSLHGLRTPLEDDHRSHEGLPARASDAVLEDVYGLAGFASDGLEEFHFDGGAGDTWGVSARAHFVDATVVRMESKHRHTLPADPVAMDLAVWAEAALQSHGPVLMPAQLLRPAAPLRTRESAKLA